MSELGDRLRALLREKGLTVAKLASAGGIDESTMGAILSGDIARPPDRRLRGFAEALDVSFDSLLALIPEERRAEASFDAAVCAAELIAASAPEWIQLMPMGEVRFRDGREPVFVREAAAVIQASLSDTDALPIDYDHQTDFTRDSGNAAPAAGWLRELQVRDDGIWGRVEWTERGGAAVSAKEYRFISPVFHFNKKTKAVTRILRAGLTNDPALNLKAVANRAAENQEAQMDELLKKLRELLGLAEDADQKAVCSAIATAVESAEGADNGVALASVAKALGLAEDAKAEDIEIAAAKAVASAARAGDRDELAERLDKIEAKTTSDAATAAVDKAIASGKLTPGQRDWALGYAAKDPKAFETFIEAQPVVVASGAQLPGGKTPPGDGSLTADEKAICNRMGLSEDEFKKTRDAEAKKETAL